MAKPIVKPDLLLVDAQKNSRRMSSGIKGFIMGDTSKISSNFPGRGSEDRDDHLADVVDIIVARRDDQEEVDKARLLANSVTDLSEDQGTYSIANISDKFIRFDGIVTKMKKQIEEEKRIKFQEERKNRKLIRYKPEVFFKLKTVFSDLKMNSVLTPHFKSENSLLLRVKSL